MSKEYSKTKTELLQIADDLINNNGEVYKIKCIKFEQHPDIFTLTAVLPVNATHLFFQRIPRDYDNPEGLQRALKQQKITSIENLITNSARYTSPNAVVANFLTKGKSWAIKFYPDQHVEGLYWSEINLKEIKNKIEKAETVDDFLKDEEQVMLGFLIDAHHRTEGFYSAGKMSFELPITLYVDLPKKEMAEVFVNINQWQEKPNPTHTLAMRAISNSLSSKEEQAYQIMSLLNESEWSVLFNRIKVYDGAVPKGNPKPYINGSTFHNLTSKYVNHAISDTLTPITKAGLINNYFSAWKNVFPKAWEDQNKHVLVKSMGFQIMIRLFEKIMIHTTMKYSKLAPTESEFTEIIKHSFGGNQTIILGADDNDSVSIPLTWESKLFGSYSSGKGINEITEVLKGHMTNRLALSQIKA